MWCQVEAIPRDASEERGSPHYFIFGGFCGGWLGGFGVVTSRCQAPVISGHVNFLTAELQRKAGHIRTGSICKALGTVYFCYLVYGMACFKRSVD